MPIGSLRLTMTHLTAPHRATKRTREGGPCGRPAATPAWRRLSVGAFHRLRERGTLHMALDSFASYGVAVCWLRRPRAG